MEICRRWTTGQQYLKLRKITHEVRVEHMGLGHALTEQVTCRGAPSRVKAPSSTLCSLGGVITVAVGSRHWARVVDGGGCKAPAGSGRMALMALIALIAFLS